MPKPKSHFNLDLVNALRLGVVRVQRCKFVLGRRGSTIQQNRKGWNVWAQNSAEYGEKGAQTLARQGLEQGATKGNKNAKCSTPLRERLQVGQSKPLAGLGCYCSRAV